MGTESRKPAIAEIEAEILGAVGRLARSSAIVQGYADRFQEGIAAVAAARAERAGRELAALRARATAAHRSGAVANRRTARAGPRRRGQDGRDASRGLSVGAAGIRRADLGLLCPRCGSAVPRRGAGRAVWGGVCSRSAAAAGDRTGYGRPRARIDPLRPGPRSRGALAASGPGVSAGCRGAGPGPARARRFIRPGPALCAFLRLPASLRVGDLAVTGSEVEALLRGLSEHVSEVNKTRLTNVYDSVEGYNAAGAGLAIPYQVLVVDGFPAGFNEEAAALVTPLADNGPRLACTSWRGSSGA